MKEGDIMEKYNKERLARASEAVRKAGLSQIIVSDAAALWYLTEEEIHPGERLTVLVIPSDSDPYWVRNRLFPLKSNGIADHPFEDGEDGIGLLASLLADGRTGVDGVCHSAFLLDLMGRGGNRTFVNGSPLIDALRAVKDEEEIRRMKAASSSMTALSDASVISSTRVSRKRNAPKSFGRFTRKRALKDSPSRRSFPSVRTAPTRTIRPTTRNLPQATPSSLTSAARRTITAPT